MTDNERQQILKMIEDGKISAEEGLALINALGSDPDDYAQETATPEPEPSFKTTSSSAYPEFEAKIKRFRRLWLIPLTIGIAITVGAAIWMNAAYQSGGMGFGFFFALLTLFAGVAITTLGASSRTMRWIYVDVDRSRDKDKSGPRRIRLAFPVPVALLRWGVGFARRDGSMPERDASAATEVINAMFDGNGPSEPILVDVDDDDARVRVYIG